VRQFENYVKHFADVPGWFYPEAIALWDSLLDYQETAAGKGNFLEIGVFKGKSAGMLALHTRSGESCTLVDLLPTDEAKASITQAAPLAQCNYVQEHSAGFLYNPLVRQLKESVRWMHIDGGHSSADVMTDLTIAHKVLQDDGILVLDDFFSPAYPQIASALFGYLAKYPGHFSLFLVGFNKGYLCRPAAKPGYLSFLKDSLYNEMAARNSGDIVLWKTNTPDDLNCFGISPRGSETLHHRGLDTDHNDLPI